ncbi:MAG: DUF2807 domain-containing protein [Caulobacterales bacterium]|nr:DUF2807 domain-containing protein [Caulobacterales bacterium]
MYKIFNSVSVLSLFMLGACTFGNTISIGVSKNPNTPKQLQFNHFIGHVEYVPSNSGKIEVEIQPGAKLQPNIIREGENIIIEGNSSAMRNYFCSNINGVRTYKIDNTTYTESDLPRLKIALPTNKSLGIWTSSINGMLGDFKSADIRENSCGSLKIGNVTNDVNIDLGSNDIVIGNIGGKLDINIDGSGDVKTGSVNGETKINIDGSGSVSIAKQIAKINAEISGSGDIYVADGGGDVDLNLGGSGSFKHLGYVSNPKIHIVGSGDVTVHEIRGSAEISTNGSGKFFVK